MADKERNRLFSKVQLRTLIQIKATSTPVCRNKLGNETILEYGIAAGRSSRGRSGRQLKPTRDPIQKCAQNS